MDPQLASYVIGYYRRFMYEREQLAYRHLIGTAKVTRGRSEGAAQAEARNLIYEHYCQTIRKLCYWRAMGWKPLLNEPQREYLPSMHPTFC
jgi:hypothetical protein